jgi:hypothetical protein
MPTSFGHNIWEALNIWEGIGMDFQDNKQQGKSFGLV